MSTPPPRKSMVRNPIFILLVVVALGAFAFTLLSNDGGSSSNAPVVTSDGLAVSRADFGADWPLTVESGVLSCIAPSSVVIEANGRMYAVNGAAKSQTGLAAIDAIWADNPSVAGLKKDIAPLVDKGLTLCR